MYTIHIFLGQLAAIIAIAQVVPYVWSIFKHRTKPSRASYGIWSIIQVIELLSYISAGATTTVWVLLVLTINAVGIFALSLKYGPGGFNKFDIPCLALSAVAIILWVTTKSPALAVYMSMAAVLIGYLPTIKKAYLLPFTENTLSWVMYFVAAVLNVFALTTFQPVIALPCFVALALSLTVAGLLVFPKWTFRSIARRLHA